MRKLEENQNFSMLVRWFMTTILLAFVLFQIFNQIVHSESSTSLFSEISLAFNLIWFSVSFAAILVLWISQLRLTITDQEIKYRFFPFELKTKVIRKSEIKLLKFVKIKWYEYGGRGKRRNFFKKKTAYLMHKNTVIEVHLLNGKTIVFSIENEKQAKRIIEQYYSELL